MNRPRRLAERGPGAVGVAPIEHSRRDHRQMPHASENEHLSLVSFSRHDGCAQTQISCTSAVGAQQDPPSWPLERELST